MGSIGLWEQRVWFRGVQYIWSMIISQLCFSNVRANIIMCVTHFAKKQTKTVSAFESLKAFTVEEAY